VGIKINAVIDARAMRVSHALGWTSVFGLKGIYRFSRVIKEIKF